MSDDVPWLDPSEFRAWLAFRHSQQQLALRLNSQLVQDSELTIADYEVLAALSAAPDGRLPAQVLCSQMRWEKSRLSHQVRRMQDDGLISREPNPADARSVIIGLLPKGRDTIERAAPEHVRTVRRHFIDLLTPAELATITAVTERVLRHLDDDTGSAPAPSNDAPEAETRLVDSP